MNSTPGENTTAGPQRSWFGFVALLLSVGALLFLACRYDICFQNSENVCMFVPNGLRNGLQFTWKDLPTSLDVWGSDGDSRPRVLSAFAGIVTSKSRLALWDYVLPHPSFTPLWALTVVLATFLLYKFLLIASGDRQAALVGAAIYLVSPGLLSGVTMLFHSAKPLANLMFITALWMAAKLQLRAADGDFVLFKAPRQYAGLFALLFLTPFADESAAFAYFAPLAWCPSLFWSRRSKLRVRLANWSALLLPAIAAACVIIFVLPALTKATFNKEFNLLGYLDRSTVGERFKIPYILWTGYNLLAAQTLPGAFDNVDVPVRWPHVQSSRIDLPIASVVVGIAVIVGLTWVMRRQKTWSTFFKLELLAGVFILFQAAVLLCHPLLLVAPGFYYGALFSILFSSIVALVYSTLRRRGTRVAGIAAAVLILLIGAVSLRNFIPLNASWMRHENCLALAGMKRLPFYEKQGDWAKLDELRLAEPHYYSSDAERAPGDTPLGDTRKIWRRWQHGDSQLLEGVVHIRDLWVVQELTLKTSLSPLARAENSGIRR